MLGSFRGSIMINLAAAFRMAIAGIAAAALLFFAGVAWAAFRPPPLEQQHGQVIDEAGKLAAGEREYLNGKIEKARRATGFPLVVFLPRSLEGESIEDAAYETFKQWRL